MDGVDEASSRRIGPTRTPEGRFQVCSFDEEDKRSKFQRETLDAAACCKLYLICQFFFWDSGVIDTTQSGTEQVASKSGAKRSSKKHHVFMPVEEGWA